MKDLLSVLWVFVICGVPLVLYILVVGLAMRKAIDNYEKKKTDSHKRVVKIEDTCVLCGDYIPEGSHICHYCKILNKGEKI